MGMAEIFGHLPGIVELGDGGGEMVFPGQEDVLGAAGEICTVLLGEHGNREGVPAHGVGVAVSGFQLAADCGDPDQMETGSNQRHGPEGGVVEGKGEI